MKILTYKQYEMAEDLSVLISNPIINESGDIKSQIDSILKKLSKDLKFNYSLVLTFGVGVRLMYPIVEGLIKNGSLNVEMNMENIILLSIASLTITYLEESKNKSGDSNIPCDCKDKVSCNKCDGTGMIKSLANKNDARTILEELKLRGIGNGIVKKMVDCFKFFGNIFTDLFKNTKYVIGGLIDMLTYTSILIPIMNGISIVVGKYNLTLDSVIGNTYALTLGVSMFLSKHGFEWLYNKIKGKISNPDVKNLDKSKLINDSIK